MKSILRNNIEYKELEYKTEEEFEKDIVENSKKIFGDNTYYVDAKKLLKGNSKNGTIPDGYLLDCTIQSKPKLYLVENELKGHSIRDHIAPQLVQFCFNYKINFLEIKDLIVKKLNEKDIDVDSIARCSGFRNADDMLTKIINNEKLGVIIPIDEISSELEELKSMFRFNIELLQFKKYVSKDDTIFIYDTFNEEYSSIPTNESDKELDTILVSAEEDGFKEEFIENNRWYAVKIGINMLDKIKYIAVYQKSPVKAITYYAEVSTIDLYEDTGKYILYFNGSAKKLKTPIPLNPKNPNKAPQGRVYTNIQTILSATSKTTLDDIF
jgi:hypothetical protein